jgi:hypothetical protein
VWFSVCEGRALSWFWRAFPSLPSLDRSAGGEKEKEQEPVIVIQAGGGRPTALEGVASVPFTSRVEAVALPTGEKGRSVSLR